MNVTVIIPHYSGRPKEALIDNISYIHKQLIGKDNIIVIVNGPNGSHARNHIDHILTNYLRLSKVKVRYDRDSKTSYDARNTAVKDFRTNELILFTDDDVIVDSNWVNRHKEFYALDVDIVSGITEFNGKRIIDTDPKTFCPITANLSIRKELFIKMGCFNSGVESGEDREFVKRCVDKGWRLAICTDAIVVHKKDSYITQLRKELRYGGGNKLKEALGIWWYIQVDAVNNHVKSNFFILGAFIKALFNYQIKSK